MPAHYKPQSHHTEHHLHPRPHTLRPDRMPSGRLDPQPRLPWSPRHQKQQYSPYAPSAFANMVGSFAESYEYLQPHLNRATSRRNPFTTKSQHYEYRNDSDTMPSYDDYQKPSSSPTNMAISTYTTRSDSGSGSSSSASATLVGRDGRDRGGNAAVWSPLREWTEGACTANRDRLVDYCQANDLAEPMYKTYSDRRGGRTAWSCSIALNPNLEIPARLWFDGRYVENAGEDAAERAWDALMAGARGAGDV